MLPISYEILNEQMHLYDAAQHGIYRIELLALFFDLVLHLLAAAADRLQFGREVLPLEELELEARQSLHVLVALSRFLRAPTMNKKYCMNSTSLEL